MESFLFISFPICIQSRDQSGLWVRRRHDCCPSRSSAAVPAELRASSVIIDVIRFWVLSSHASCCTRHYGYRNAPDHWCSDSWKTHLPPAWCYCAVKSMDLQSLESSVSLSNIQQQDKCCSSSCLLRVAPPGCSWVTLRFGSRGDCGVCQREDVFCKHATLHIVEIELV